MHNMMCQIHGSMAMSWRDSQEQTPDDNTPGTIDAASAGVNPAHAVGANAQSTNAALIREFQRVTDDNAEIIQQHSVERTVRYFQYRFTTHPVVDPADPPEVKIEEIPMEGSCTERLREWAVPKLPKIQPSVPTHIKLKLFDLQTNFTVSKYPDLVRLNVEQAQEVDCWAFFEDSARVTNPLRVLLSNAQAINVHLKNASSVTQDSKSVMQECMVRLGTLVG